MAKENGKVPKDLSLIIMMVITQMIKNTVTEFFLGQVVMFTKVNTKKTKEKGMEK